MAERIPGTEKEVVQYRLLITPHLAERTQTIVTRVVLETTKTFATFRYELSVREKIATDAIRLAVLGFKTPQLTLPASGPARFQKDYDALSGTYTLVVEGIDGRENSFSIRISSAKVEVLKMPRKSFVQIVTELSHWPSPTA